VIFRRISSGSVVEVGASSSTFPIRSVALALNRSASASVVFPAPPCAMIPTFRICWMSTLTVLLRSVCSADRGFTGQERFLSYIIRSPSRVKFSSNYVDFLRLGGDRRASPPVAITRGSMRTSFRIRSMIPSTIATISVEKPRLHRRHRVLPDDRGGLDDLDPGKLRCLRKRASAEMFTPGAITPPM